MIIVCASLAAIAGAVVGVIVGYRAGLTEQRDRSEDALYRYEQHREAVHGAGGAAHDVGVTHVSR